MNLVITMIGGQCPMQAEGTINGKPFYFRARGEHWSFSVGDGDIHGDTDWYLSVRWSRDQFGAGWMTEAQARAIIAQCAIAYSATIITDSGGPNAT